MSLLAISFADPNRISSTYKAGEIWSTAKDGATGLDGKTRKKLWNRLKREVIYRDSPEDLERKEREENEKTTQEYRLTLAYKERVAIDLARVKFGEPAPRFVPEPVVEDDTPTRHDLFLAKVATAQRVMSGIPEPRGLPHDILTLAKDATRGREVKRRKKRRRR